MPSDKRYTLGIDIGTTTVKVALLDSLTTKVLQTKCRESHAHINSNLGSLGNEQDISKILTALQFCVSAIGKEQLRHVKQIALSCQMHGIVFWGDTGHHGFNRNSSSGRIESDVSCSHLYTWQDGRCNDDFLKSLPVSKENGPVSTGYGMATLLWLDKHQPDILSRAKAIGTIGDYVTSALCENLGVATMSTHNAVSWGYYSMSRSCWEKELLSEAQLSTSLLPRVLEPGLCCGSLSRPWYGVAEGCEVVVCSGDAQCSAYARLHYAESAAKSAVLNISTSAQLAFTMPVGFHPHHLKSNGSSIVDNSGNHSSRISYIPYFPDFSASRRSDKEAISSQQAHDKVSPVTVTGSRYLAVAASLTGGNVLSSFVNMLQQWTHELGMGVPEEKIWQVIQRLARHPPTSGEMDMNIIPTVFGERHCPNQKATVSNIGQRNHELGSVYRSLCQGVVSNLETMMTSATLKENSITRILGSGAAIAKNPLIKEQIEKLYNLPVEMCKGGMEEADSAIGAALARIHYVNLTK